MGMQFPVLTNAFRSLSFRYMSHNHTSRISRSPRTRAYAAVQDSMLKVNNMPKHLRDHNTRQRAANTTENLVQLLSLSRWTSNGVNPDNILLTLPQTTQTGNAPPSPLGSLPAL